MSKPSRHAPQRSAERVNATRFAAPTQFEASERQDRLVDQALMDTFPASDPISPCCFD
jgi:hypothetical protein